MKKLIRLLLLAGVVAAIVWFTRERMLPNPPPPAAHPPPFRRPPATDDDAPEASRGEDAPASEDTSAAPGTQDADDLKQVKGIGPVYEGKLNALGITTFTQLVGADSEHVADELDVSVASIVEWKTQATAFLG